MRRPKVLDNKIHGFLDYLTVLAFAAIPTFFGLKGLPANLSYLLAIIHFLMTILTNFEVGLFKVLPLRIHKFVEVLVGPGLMVSPWVFGFSHYTTARHVYIGAGIAINLISWISRYTMI